MSYAPPPAIKLKYLFIHFLQDDKLTVFQFDVSFFGSIEHVSSTGWNVCG